MTVPGTPRRGIVEPGGAQHAGAPLLSAIRPRPGQSVIGVVDFQDVARVEVPAGPLPVAVVAPGQRGDQPAVGRRLIGISEAGAQRLKDLGSAGGAAHRRHVGGKLMRSEEHTSELQSLMRISYAVFCLKKKNKQPQYEYMYMRNSH